MADRLVTPEQTANWPHYHFYIGETRPENAPRVCNLDTPEIHALIAAASARLAGEASGE